ncbi:glycerophosphodiester phosphodiesterase [Aestuariirhabdus sp. Z084]|uniref:glycerophosphodiester phosphodiesterase family protein n=1 Tax=Aestuariirhabdus haliotis TaxID=2918751 RepID=UPI00201B424C|nr:glycerophosphodiester phosphodiesterase family protein [Aestuariirhabdus haliotis]MCL6417431.1 glycerophosphodiester phosphodiesterase [Aestuariirhabdus haliotis]MCL6421375.1 glycerophosphodiester phosphodiesterase [Aestuariirhabdus haliotis]
MNRLVQILKVGSAMLLAAGIAPATVADDGKALTVQLGPRPFFLVDAMQPSPLKTRLQQCKEQRFEASDLSIGHRGAPLQFPEHTRESYIAAAVMGAGVLECDVTFTKDKELVCRHSQSDLHTTTNILSVPELAAKCSTPPDFTADKPFENVECRTSDITLDEFLSLQGKMDAGNSDAKTLEEYLDATANYRTDLYATSGTLMSHKQSIELFKQLGVKMTPELKAPAVEMPYQGNYRQQDYAQQLIDEYKQMGIDPSEVFPQSFNYDDLKYWLSSEPGFARQAVYLDGRYNDDGFDHSRPETWSPSMDELVAQGVKIIAPPMWMLVKVENGKIVPSAYARNARAAGLDIITWTLERSGPLNEGGGWYYQTTKAVIDNDGDTYEMLDVLVREVGVIGVFSDWPATVTYYAGCME